MDSGRVAVLSDFQIPFHDPKKIEWARDVVRKFKPTHLVINGDAVDYHGIGKGKGVESSADYLDEAKTCADILGRLRKSAGRNCRSFYYLDGNHEYRLRKLSNENLTPYLRRALEFENIRGVGDEMERWRRIPYMNRPEGVLTIGPLIICHGFDAGSSSNELEAIKFANLIGGLYGNRLVCRGHTHKIIQPTRCSRTKTIPIALYHTNTGTFCDPSKMDWTTPIDVSQWEAGVLLCEFEGLEWEAHVEVYG